MIASDNYHPPLSLDFKLTNECQHTFLTPRCSNGRLDCLKMTAFCLLFCDTLSSSDWSYFLYENYVDSAVYDLIASMSKAVNEAIPSVQLKVQPFLTHFPNLLYCMLF
jgi:hypothetical protein